MKNIVKMSVTVLCFGAITTAPVVTLAATVEVENGYFQIQSMEHRELSDAESRALGLPVDDQPSDEQHLPGTDAETLINNPFPAPRGLPHNPSVGPGIVDKAIRIINTGKQAWEIIKKGQPSRTQKYDVANALPANVSSWNDLSEWKVATSKNYIVSYRNFVGQEVVRFVYRLIFNFNGTDGKGRYLARISFVPVTTQVSWGYDFDVIGKINNVFNIGTNQEPVAAAEMQLEWNISNVFMNHLEAVNFAIDGNGEIEKI